MKGNNKDYKIKAQFGDTKGTGTSDPRPRKRDLGFCELTHPARNAPAFVPWMDSAMT